MSEQIEYTFEILYHFTCLKCKNWWSYSITPSSDKMNFNINDHTIHCMHCGNVGKPIINAGFDDILNHQNIENPQFEESG